MDSPNARDARARRERRIVVGSMAACVLLAIGVVAAMYGPAYLAYCRYVPREGDIVFQSLPRAPLVNAIEGASESPYSHCGIVARLDGRWVVYEAYRGVEATALREFVFRGRRQGFAVYRLTPDHQHHIAATIGEVREYIGRPYDSRYRMDDERIYCSELIYKAYRDASGDGLGELVRLGDLDWRPYEGTIRHYEGGPVPVDRLMITPRHLALASQLRLVFRHELPAAKPAG